MPTKLRFFGWFSTKTRSVLRNRQGIPRLSRVFFAREAQTHQLTPADFAAFSFSLIALVGVPPSYWQVSLIVAPALSTTPTQHEAVIRTVNRASMWELRRRRVHSSAPSSACARPDRPSGFSRPPVWVF